MTNAGLIVIGSGPAGVAAASAYRQAGGAGPVRLFTEDHDPPYERPPLSKDVLRGAAEAADTFLHEPDFYRERDIELRLSTPVIALVPDESAIRLADGSPVHYDSCIVATGSAPVRPPIPGAQNAHVLRSRREAIALAAAASDASTAVIVGSGFIGCEAAASLAARGLKVCMVTEEVLPQQTRLGPWAADRIATWLREAGVELLSQDRLAEIGSDFVRTEAGLSRPAELVLLATGAAPQGALAADAGLDMHNGRIRVSADMRSSDASVFAVGDVAFAMNTSAQREIAAEHWGDALTMGEIAGRAAAGESAEWGQAPGFWSTIGDHTLKYTAWGDGFDDVRVDADDSENFTVRYGNEGELVGVLTHNRDDDYERGQSEVERRTPW